MRIGKAIVLCALCSTFIFPLFGCRSKDHILDGPGMVNDLTWREFTLSRSDSYAQYNFWFTVKRTENAFLLTGECRDEDGEIYIQEDGMELSGDDIRYLRGLFLGDLTDDAPDEGGEIILDAPVISLQLIYLDGQPANKRCSSDLSMELYERFLPYFQNQ